MIKLKLSEIDAMWPSFTQFLRYEFKANVAFDIFRMARHVKDVYQDFVQAREILLKQYGVEEAMGYRLPPQNASAYQRDMRPLLDKVVELPIEPLSMTMILQSAPKTMAPSTLLDLAPFFIDDVMDLDLSKIEK